MMGSGINVILVLSLKTGVDYSLTLHFLRITEPQSSLRRGMGLFAYGFLVTLYPIVTDQASPTQDLLTLAAARDGRTAQLAGLPHLSDFAHLRR